MSQSLHATAPDSYTSNGTADISYSQPFKRFILDVANQAIYWNLLKSVGGGGYWESSETFMTPGSRVIRELDMTGIRVRAAIPAASLPVGAIQAVFTIRAIDQ